MPLYLRNLTTGEIRTVEPLSPEHNTIRDQRDEGGFHVWAATSSADADPERYAHPREVIARSQWGVQPLSDITADGVATSARGAQQLANRPMRERSLAGLGSDSAPRRPRAEATRNKD